MSVGAIVFLVVFFGIFRVLRGIAAALKKIQPPDGTSITVRRTRAPGEAPQTMTELLAEMRDQLEKARDAEREKVARQRIEVRTTAPTSASTRAGASPKRLPTDIATRGSNEVSLESGSLEVAPIAVDLDEGAEAVVQRRIAAAEARNLGRTEADHRRFDASVRAAAPAAAPPPEAERLRRLRRAMIWREVLSPPVSLRGDRD